MGAGARSPLAISAAIQPGEGALVRVKGLERVTTGQNVRQWSRFAQIFYEVRAYGLEVR